MEYEHVQRGPFARIVGVFFGVVLVVSSALADGQWLVVVIEAAFMALILATVSAFSHLTVTIGPEQLTTRFGWGWPKRVIPLVDITAFHPIRTKWWYGFGIRVVPNTGVMYNVWGLNAVELDLASGQRFVIGTDDIDGLVAALGTRTLHPDA